MREFLLDMGWLFVMVGFWMAAFLAIQGKSHHHEGQLFSPTREDRLNYYRSVAMWGDLPVLPFATLLLATLLPMATVLWFSMDRIGFFSYPQHLKACLSDAPFAYGAAMLMVAFETLMMRRWAATARRYL